MNFHFSSILATLGAASAIKQLQWSAVPSDQVGAPTTEPTAAPVAIIPRQTAWDAFPDNTVYGDFTETVSYDVAFSSYDAGNTHGNDPIELIIYNTLGASNRPTITFNNDTSVNCELLNQVESTYASTLSVNGYFKLSGETAHCAMHVNLTPNLSDQLNGRINTYFELYDLSLNPTYQSYQFVRAINDGTTPSDSPPSVEPSAAPTTEPTAAPGAIIPRQTQWSTVPGNTVYGDFSETFSYVIAFSSYDATNASSFYPIELECYNTNMVSNRPKIIFDNLTSVNCELLNTVDGTVSWGSLLSANGYFKLSGENATCVMQVQLTPNPSDQAYGRINTYIELYDLARNPTYQSYYSVTSIKETGAPTNSPVVIPSEEPSIAPSFMPTDKPSALPSKVPSTKPTATTTIVNPTSTPTLNPSTRLRTSKTHSKQTINDFFHSGSNESLITVACMGLVVGCTAMAALQWVFKRQAETSSNTVTPNHPSGKLSPSDIAQLDTIVNVNSNPATNV